jgi:hypothetical protein
MIQTSFTQPTATPPFALLWRLQGPNGIITECYLTIAGDGTPELQIVRDGEAFVSQGFTATEAALMRAAKYASGLMERGWSEALHRRS